MTITDGLDTAQRDALERLVVRGRTTLEDDLASQAEGRFGIQIDGTIEDEENLHLDATAAADRREMVEVVKHLCALGETPAGAAARFLREAAFTHLNRLVAIRIAEAIGLLPESLAHGRQSAGFKQVQEVAPLLAGDYWSYLRLCGDELAADAPALFDPRNPLLALGPSPSALEKLVEALADEATAGIWLAPDTLGWVYQFFNTPDERRRMREESPAPRSSRELAVRNQFFTPRYVVDFLVQNTLGRRLVEADPTTPLLADLPVLVDPPSEPGPPLDLAEVCVLDPACGSGHFLLGCYDLLEKAWGERGVGPAGAAPRIVASLWGVDIDPRCVQVASAAIVLRARRHCRDLPLPRPNIITARALPRVAGALPDAVDLTSGERRLVEAVSDILADAPVLGTLLKVEEALEHEIRHSAFSGPSQAGSLPLADEAFAREEANLRMTLRQLAHDAASTVAERLFAAEADDALRFVDACRNRYDVVLMNPPFGEPVPETKPYLKAAYPWIPTKDSNLLAAFVGRGLGFCKPDGYLGAITSRVGMFLRTFEAWRREVLLGNRLTALADLGFGVMEQALVEAATYVIGPGQPPTGHIATFVRLLKDTDRPGGLIGAITASRAGNPDRRVFQVPLAEFDAIPGAPVAYWIGPSIRRLFSDLPPLEGSGAEARQGLATGDDFRFVRGFWEVDPRRIARSAVETMKGKRWCPFAKGGEYSPYWADIHLVVDYEREGKLLRQFPGSVIRNPQYYFRRGLTWPLRTASGFSPRILPAGCVFGHKGPAVIPTSLQPMLLAAWLNSRAAGLVLSALLAAADETTSGTASKSYEVGHIQRLPWPGSLLVEHAPAIRAAAEVTADSRAEEDRTDETARRFVTPQLFGGMSIRDAAVKARNEHDRRLLTIIERSGEIDAVVTKAILDREAEDFLESEVGRHVSSYPARQLPDDLLTDLLSLDMDTLVDRLIADVGAERITATKTYVADRRLEMIAHAYGTHPKVILDARRRLGSRASDESRLMAESMISYLMGIAFGHWDVRVGRDPSLAPPQPDLFDPVPLCSPGMLVGSDGFPVDEAPEGYPLALPPGRVLVDEPGQAWDVEAAVLRAAEALFDDAEGIMAELLEILGRKSIRDHFRRDFFRAHLSRYTKSRRKAPIYWYLSVLSRNWGVWAYAPALSREMLFAVAGQAARRERLAGEAIARLHREQEAGGAGRSVRAVVAELDAEARLAEELRRFRAEAGRIAGLGWKPDLDDGIVLCAAPLADLFPAWPDARKARDELREGEYTWATVARWAGRL